MSDLPLCDRLAALAEPYALVQETPLFAEAMAEADRWHQERNPAYARLWEGETRPLLPVSLFKKIDLATPVEAEGRWLSSSGTGDGGKTKVFFDTPSLRRIEQAMGRIFFHQGIFSPTPARFLLLSPDPTKGDHAGYATAFVKFTACAPVQEVVFAVDPAGCFDASLALRTLKRWGSDCAPIFIFGLTVYFEHLALAGVAESPLLLQGPIRGLTGGGWKGLSKTLERSAIIESLRGSLKAPLVDIRDIYGLTEHPLHYVSCAEGHFHLPGYSRFSLLTPSGEEAQTGEPGLIRLQNPFFAALPAHDLLTQDHGLRGENCPCGESLPYLRFLGRVGTHEGTCAATTTTSTL